MTSKERAAWRAKANSLEAIIQIGKEGITDNLITQIDDLQPFDAEAFASAMFDIKPTHDDDDTIVDFINENVKAEEEPTEEDKK